MAAACTQGAETLSKPSLAPPAPPPASTTALPAAPSAARRPARSSEAERVAVCFGGWVATTRGLADGGESLRRHLLAPLGTHAWVVSLPAQTSRRANS